MPRNDQVIRQWKILKLLEARGRVMPARLADDLDEPRRPRMLWFPLTVRASHVRAVTPRNIAHAHHREITV